MKHLKKGLIYTGIGVYSNFIVQIIVNMVLSRILTPNEYGVVAIMQVFIIFFAMMVEAGMGPAIIQSKSLNKEKISILFNYSVIFAVTMTVLFGLLGILLSVVYDNKIYISLTWIQSISVLFNGMNVVPTALLNKRKEFKVANFSLVFGNIVAAFVGIISALLGAGVYSLIFSAISVSFVNLLWNLFFTKIKVTRSFNPEPMREILNFSANQFGFNFINYFSRNADNILVGKFMGDAALANYSKAYQMLMMPNTLFLGIINPVLQPVLGDYQEDVAYIRQTYYKIIHFLALVGIPLSVFLHFSAKEIIFFMFGNQWGASISPFSILSLTVWCQLTISSTGAIVQARNQPSVVLRNGIISAMILVSSIVIGISFKSLTILSICLSIGFLMNFFVGFYRVTHITLNSRMRIFLKEFVSPFCLGAILFLALFVIQKVEISSDLVFLIVKVLITLIIFTGYILMTNEKAYIKEVIRR
ncbi:lipopolysaccharide biosynthesis protein [Lactococcus lactis]|uniref:lipopolysaccharide biosynthesis protein n=1 Tax=Lactococcus lactis TaxID=1358 RepID=UPI0028903EBC|nr:lipopolysaccharide biosynthesis protein [Lactococcus lactis]MDT2926302.1 lipopolysaccharide biosynthesis protein [Lactococcus lactis]